MKLLNIDQIIALEIALLKLKALAPRAAGLTLMTDSQRDYSLLVEAKAAEITEAKRVRELANVYGH